MVDLLLKLALDPGVSLIHPEYLLPLCRFIRVFTHRLGFLFLWQLNIIIYRKGSRFRFQLLYFLVLLWLDYFLTLHCYLYSFSALLQFLFLEAFTSGSILRLYIRILNYQMQNHAQFELPFHELSHDFLTQRL